jgi:hypothetical protein
MKMTMTSTYQHNPRDSWLKGFLSTDKVIHDSYVKANLKARVKFLHVVSWIATVAVSALLLVPLYK